MKNYRLLERPSNNEKRRVTQKGAVRHYLLAFEAKLRRNRAASPAAMDMKMDIWSALYNSDLPRGEVPEAEIAIWLAVEVFATSLPIAERYVERGLLSKKEARRALDEMMALVPSAFEKPLTKLSPEPTEPSPPASL